MDQFRKRLKTVILNLKSAKFSLKDSARILLGRRSDREPGQVRICPKCSEKNDLLAIRCKACSEALPRPSLPSLPPSPPPAVHREVRTCPNCRAGMPVGATRCALCGASLEGAARVSQSPIPAIKWIVGGAALILVLLLLLVLLDFTVLNGTTVYQRRESRFPESQVLEFKVPVDRPGVEHWLLIHTPHDLLAISWEVQDPDGREVCKGSDADRRGGWRRSLFVPQTDGDYTLRIKPKEGCYAYDTDWVNVEIVRDKRQILWPIIQRIL